MRKLAGTAVPDATLLDPRLTVRESTTLAARTPARPRVSA
jgi:hypothetical protein